MTCCSLGLVDYPFSDQVDVVDCFGLEVFVLDSIVVLEVDLVVLTVQAFDCSRC